MAMKVKRGTIFLRDGTVMLKPGKGEPMPLNPIAELSSEARDELDRASAGNEIAIKYTPDGPTRVKKVRLDSEVKQPASQPRSEVPRPVRRSQPPPRRPAPAAHDASPIPGGEFENPYNFVPPNPALRQHPDLKEGPALGLERLHCDRISGQIAVRFTAVTPVVIPDIDFEEAANGHKTFHGRSTPDGKLAVVPPTTIKGSLRSAFEAITSSRFGVMSRTHEEPVGLRLSTQRASELVPVRIVEKDAGRLAAELLTGSHPRALSSGPPDTLYPAALPTYKIADSHQRPETGPGAGLAHGDRVRVKLERLRHRHYQYWKVLEATKLSQDSLAPPSTRHGDEAVTHGWVCRTNANIGNKHDERVFFCLSEPEELDVPPTLRRQWSALIRDYQREHSLEIAKRLKKKKQKDTPANRREAAKDFEAAQIGKTSFSRHVYEPEAVTLRAGTLCYAKLREVQGGKRIDALYPVMLSRVLAKHAPVELASDLVPAVSDDQLTAAERLFGWVSAAGAIRGRVRIGPARCQQSLEPLDPPITLANLASPKPAQGRFYEARDRYGTPLGDVPKERFYSNKNGGLRGWKVYPHQTSFGEAASRAEWSAREPTDQNCTITSWIAPKTTFEVEIHLGDVSRVEAGALLWLLDLGRRDGVLKIGRAKPLGFGSVAPEVTEQTLLHSGATLKRAMRDLVEPAEPEDLDELKQAFLDAAGGEMSTHLQAFLNASRGTSHPVRYPRSRPQAEKQYEWFVSNENGPKHSKEEGPKHSLPHLANDDRRLPPL